jgi:type VI secretion system protein ImpH
MATAQRQHDALVERLERDGRFFGFFQAVQLLHRLSPNAPLVGELGPPGQEPVRFKHDAQMVFHSGDIERIAVREGPDGVLRAEVTTTFMGLVGTTSPLSVTFSEEVLRAEAQDETSLLAFYDLFHHRLVSLVFRAWRKYRFYASARSDLNDTFTRRMLSFVGIDAAGAIPQRGIAPFDLLALAPLLGLNTRSARTLQIVLERMFPGTRITIAQFALRRVQIREDERCLVSRQNNVLNQNFCIGRTVGDRSGRFRVVIGPVDYGMFEALMPGGRQHARVRDVVMQFSPAHLEPELELVLDAAHAPHFQLGSERGGRLGVTTHLPMRQTKAMRARVTLSEDIAEATPRLFSDEAAPDSEKFEAFAAQ